MSVSLNENTNLWEMTVQIVGKDSLYQMANLLGGLNSAIVDLYWMD